MPALAIEGLWPPQIKAIENLERSLAEDRYIGDGTFVDARAHISQEHYEQLLKHRVEPGDLIIAALGDRPPRSCIAPDIGPAIVKADCIRFRSNHKLAAPAFLNVVLNAEPTRKRTAASVHGVGRPRLNLLAIRSIAVPLPPLAEQRRILAEVDSRMAGIEPIKQAIYVSLLRLRLMRQAMLKQAFEGKLVAQNPNDERASTLLERIRAERMAAKETDAGSVRPPTRRGRTRRKT